MRPPAPPTPTVKKVSVLRHRSPLQFEVDAVEKLAALRPVTDAYLEGRHDDIDALEIAGHAQVRIIHRLRVCRSNHSGEAAA